MNHNFNELNQRFSTIESLLTAERKVNAAITRRSYFKHLDIYNEVMNKTSELDVFNPAPSFSERIYYLLGLTQFERCNICNKQHIYFNNSQHHYALCSHKQHYSIDSQQKAKTSRMNNLIDFKKSLDDNSMRLAKDDFCKKLDEYFNKKENYAFSPTKDCDFFHDLIVKTLDVLPLNEAKYDMSHRLFLAKNNIFKKSDLPTCKYCGKQTYFMNRIDGYAQSCIECSKIKAIETRSSSIVEKIDQLIDTDKYQIIEYPRLLNFGFLKVKCNKCNTTSEWKLHNGKLAQLSQMRLCKHCEKPIGSNGEEEILHFLSSFYKKSIVHGTNGRKTIYPYELDFYFPDCNVAIEYDGIYWHSFDILDKPNENRHLDKTVLCEKKGISLLHIFSDEWELKKDICKRYIKEALSCYVKKDFLSDFSIDGITYEEAANFHDCNNVDGSIKANINIGIKKRNKLIAVGSFRTKTNKASSYSLVRFSYDFEYEGVDCLNTILNYMNQKLHATKIECYIDRHQMSGKLFMLAGFMIEREMKPVRRFCTNSIRFSKTTRKKDLVDVEKYDHSMSLDENLSKAGIRKIFDCGKLVLVKIFS